VHGYDRDPYREYVRSTRAHNTVMIGGQEQSELWGTFRVARRAQVVSSHQSAEGAEYRFQGAYRPFHRRRAVHSRVIAYNGALTVTDRVTGADALPLQSFLHLHPSWRVTQDAEGITAVVDGRVVTIRPFGADRVELRTGERDPVQGWYCPEFGMAVAAAVLEMHCGPGRGREFGYHIEIEHV
jgi:hypothetical protein